MLNSRELCHEADAKNCEGIFQIVHKCNSQFVNHAMQSSNPFTICTDSSTFKPYRITMEYYNKLFTTIDPKNASVLCSDEILNKNRMNIILNFVGHTRSSWELANCDSCYGGIVSTVQKFSRDTEDFIGAHDLLNVCVQNITEDPVVKNSVVCTTCEASYETLNGLYERIKTTTNNKVCFDLEDKVSR